MNYTAKSTLYFKCFPAKLVLFEKQRFGEGVLKMDALTKTAVKWMPIKVLRKDLEYLFKKPFALTH